MKVPVRRRGDCRAQQDLGAPGGPAPPLSHTVLRTLPCGRLVPLKAQHNVCCTPETLAEGRKGLGKHGPLPKGGPHTGPTRPEAVPAPVAWHPDLGLQPPPTAGLRGNRGQEARACRGLHGGATLPAAPVSRLLRLHRRDARPPSVPTHLEVPTWQALPHLYFSVRHKQESACDAGDLGSIPGLGSSSGEGNGNPLQYSCLENSVDRSLMGYSLWGCKESDTTERLTHMSTKTSTRRDGQTDGRVCSRETRPADAPIHPGSKGRPRRASGGETLRKARPSCVHASVWSEPLSFELLHKHPQPLPKALLQPSTSPAPA